MQCGEVCPLTTLLIILNFTIMAPAVGAALVSAIPSLVGSIGGLFGNKSTNDTQLQIAKENNALQNQMFHENLDFNYREAERTRDFNHLEAMLNRDFQAEQAQINRDWESIGSQVQRAYDEGINPQAILSGGMGSTPVQPSSSSASGTPASGSQIPSFSLPHLTSPMAAWSALSDVGLKIYQAQALKADAEKKSVEAAGQKIQNDYMPQIIENNLDVSKKTAEQLSASVNQINANIDVLKTQVDDIKSQISARRYDMNLKDAQRVGQEIENFFAGDRYRAQIRNFNANSYKQEQEVDLAWKRLTLEQAIGQANINYFGSLSKYYGALVEQVGYQNKYYTGMTNLLHWQSQNERQRYLFDSIWTPRERRLGIEEREYRIKQFDYETDSWFRFTQGWKDILSPVGSIVGGAAGGYVGVKGLKMKYPMVKPNPIGFPVPM